MSTLDSMAWENDMSVPSMDAALEVLSHDSTTIEPQGPAAGPVPLPDPAIDPGNVDKSSTSHSFGEADTSSDSISPISIPGSSALDSYLGEDMFALDGSESGAWADGQGGTDILQPLSFMLPHSAFLPYVRMFFKRLYPVFPVVDRDYLLVLLESDDHKEQPLPAGLYSFLAALSAAVIVQLNLADTDTHEAQNRTFGGGGNDTEPIPNLWPAFSAQFFITQCMQARQQRDFIADPNEWTILTSFFLFAYHGNLDQYQSAWYYLREAIGFTQTLGLDESDTYTGLDTETAQRRCRIFWLLFITERAYAIQHRRRAVLGPTIDLPRVFDSRDPRLVFGFVTLAQVFTSVDESLITAWRHQPLPGAVDTSHKASQSAARFLCHPDAAGVTSEIEETQRLDILITHYWLRVLVCQLRIGHTQQLIAGADTTITRCVLDTSRNLLQTISSASPKRLESHGIGMEQKIYDVASCLCSILAGLDTAEFSTDFFSAPDLLHNFMIFLTGFRNHESQYLQPLAEKATTVLAARLLPSSFAPTTTNREVDQEVASYEG
ncbi:hypothetical protein THAR02_10394 [Trichoderma harzianum]|uniref:Xylanolytic transcriptional activator regulatory domain-containing protein n=1 Tax=Trichoderma harzianum TaxID=5544 RepID=A0A0F9WYI2_TRIHA|nr:hypothetical protein THAR02_10394 [Trichoderma harzianum]